MLYIIINCRKVFVDKLKKIGKFHIKWQIREKEEYRKIVLTDTLEVHIIELPKLIKQLENNKGNKKDKLILWLMFLLNPENVGDEDMNENEDIKKALEELEKIKENEQDRRLAELRMKHILDQNSIRKSGFREGERSKQLEIARNLLRMKITIEQICQATELTEEEIKNIK